MSESPPREQPDLASSAQELSDAIRQGPREELCGIRSDLLRVKKLLSDSVASLQKSFYQLGSQVQSQREQVASLLATVDARQAGAEASKAAEHKSIRSFINEIGPLLKLLTELLTRLTVQGAQGAERVDGMNRELGETFKLLSQIESIARQTDIIALNAAIEAAHAGEMGQGFGVLATEVRNLSAFSKKLNEQISSQLKKTRSVMGEVQEILVESSTRDKDATLKASTRIQQSLAQLADLDRSVSKGLDLVAQISAKTSDDVASAVRALQFEDIVGQLIDSVQRRLERVDDALILFERLGASLANSPESIASELELQLKELDQCFAEEVASPVLQTSMAGGEVELF